MGKLKSGIKRHKQSLKKRDRNRHLRSTVKSVVKEIRAAITENAGAAAELLPKTVSTITRAGSKGVLHKKTVARKVARLSKAVAKASKSK